MNKETNYILVLRCVNRDMTSRGSFKYPRRGYVSCPEWRRTKTCGHGLHGWRDGVGDIRHTCPLWALKYDGKLRSKILWLVIKVRKCDYIAFEGKVKFSRGYVLFCGNKKSASEYLCARSERARKALLKANSEYLPVEG